MANPVGWAEIMGTDLEAMKRFYGGLFGWEFQDFPGMSYVTVGGGDEAGAGVGIGVDPQVPSAVTFYIAVPDVAAALARAVELGGKVLQEETHVMEGVTVGMFADPEGHAIGLMKG